MGWDIVREERPKGSNVSARLPLLVVSSMVPSSGTVIPDFLFWVLVRETEREGGGERKGQEGSLVSIIVRLSQLLRLL